MSRPHIRAVLADDEPLAREAIALQLRRHPDVRVVARCDDGLEAVDGVRAHAPDLLFLDIQMPGMDGFSVVEAIGVERMPVVIFVTAYDAYALRAFEVCALDYLLKPFDEERFDRALARARDRILNTRMASYGRRLAALIDQPRRDDGEAGPVDGLAFKVDGRLVVVPPDDIDWIEAADYYVRVHVGRKAYLVRETLSRLESRLDANRFVRVHRSAIVHVGRVKELAPRGHGEGSLYLRDGTRLKVSRSRRGRLLQVLATRR